MSALAEKLRHSVSTRAVFKYTAVVIIAALLLYYCIHPDLYTGERNLALWQSKKTYVTAGISFLLLVLLLVPNRMKEALNRRLSWAWFAVAPFAVYFSLLYLNADKFDIRFFQLNKIALGFTFLFLYLVQGFLFCITGSIRFSVVIYAVAVAVLGIANCFVISFRGMALSAGDLFSIRAAASVASGYTYTPDWYMFMELLLTFAICTVSLKLRGGRMAHPAVRAAMLALCTVLASGFYYVCCRTDYLEEHNIRSEGFSHQLRYKQFDMLFTTLCTCFYLSADRPEDYSAERVKELAAEYVEESSAARAADTEDGGKTAKPKDSGNAESAASENRKELPDSPNIIVIMNESFADYTDIGAGLTLSEDCMPFLHGLTENTIKGTAYASVFGGNTPNSEYEFLTGNTMGFLPASSVGFNLFVRGEMPSLASQLKTLGYCTLAMHPYRGNNYRRHIVYPQIGFDTYYTREDFEEKSYIRSFISDQCLAERIISEYEKNQSSGTPLFSYNVTVQNHGGYSAANQKNLSDEIKVLDEDVDQTKTQIYVNLIRESDRMLEGLVRYFEKQEEPTVILMFGDHQAELGAGTYRHLIGSEEELTQEELMEKYRVPFVIWANYDIEEETIEKTSLNYLASIMADRLDLPMTGYQKYLLDLQEEIPVINSLGYWGKNGTFYLLDDEESPYYETVEEYHILEYNYIFGKKDRYLEFLELPEAG